MAVIVPAPVSSGNIAAGPIGQFAVSSGGPVSYTVGSSYAWSNSSAIAGKLTLSDGSGGSVSMHPEGNILIIGDESTTVRIPGRLEWTPSVCIVCAAKPELGVVLQGSGSAIMFCPSCAQKQLASATVQEILKQYAVMKTMEESGGGCPNPK